MSDRDHLLDQIKMVSQEQFYELVFRCNLKRSVFPDGTNQAERSVLLIERMEDRDPTLQLLEQALYRTQADAPSYGVRRPASAVPASNTNPELLVSSGAVMSNPSAVPSAPDCRRIADLVAPIEQRFPRPTQQVDTPNSESELTLKPIPGSMLVTRSSLRCVIGKVLPGSAQLDAFLFDHFPNVWDRIHSDQDRATRINLLFLNEETKVILDRLREQAPVEVALHQDLLAPPNLEADDTNLALQANHGGRIEIRKLLAQLFEFDSELNAFCIDYFPDLQAIHVNSSDTDRTYKYDLLINSTRPGKLFASLYRQYPEKLQRLQRMESEPAPTLASLRCLLRIVLHGATELQQFFCQYYPHLYLQLSSGFDRVRVENTLMQGTHPVDLLRTLREASPHLVTRFEYLLEFCSPCTGHANLDALRGILHRSLALDSEVDAFCLDHFPAVAGTFTDGTNKDEKIKRLLSSEPAESIQRALRLRNRGLPPEALPMHLVPQDNTRANGSMALSQATLRRLINGFFPDDAPFSKFCEVYFPHAANLLMPGMNKSQKINILLQKIDHVVLVSRLQDFSPETFERLSKQQLQMSQDFIMELTSIENHDITRTQIRNLINVVLVGDELISFCADFFPSVQPFISVGMERTAIVSLLIQRIPPSILLAALRHVAPERVQMLRLTNEPPK